MAESGQTETNVNKQDENKPKADDKCIGNRRVRTVLLCILEFTFFLFAAGYLLFYVDTYSDLVDAGLDVFSGGYSSMALVFSGCIITMVGCIVTAVLYFIPKCDKKMGRVGGVILILGGVLYILGWVWNITWQKDNSGYDSYTDDQKQDADALWLSQFGEALLPAGSAVVLGLDALFLMFDKESFRLFINLGLLMGVSILIMPAYFIWSGNDPAPDGAAVIGTGYLFILLASGIYVILFMLSCCHNCHDKKIVRIILAITLICSGILCSFGYWLFAGEGLGSTSGSLGDDTFESKRVAYYVGYTIIVTGLTSVWGLDVAWDDYKNQEMKCCKS